MASQRSTLVHIPALDGLRGVALLGVLLFHSNGLLTGGYLGVDLFFVLSGFLITSLLVTEHAATGRIALTSFWIRRARRLFPALLSLMPAIALYGRYVAKPDELAGLRRDALATLGYVANWRTIFAHKSYWELFVSPSPLEHTWSLSIEEQFYVVWPLIVVIVLRHRSRRAVLVVALALTALSIAATLALYSATRTTRVYLGTDTRAAGILLGAALATLIPTDATAGARVTRVLDLLGLAALIGLGDAWWKIEGNSRFLYHGGLWLTELAALVLIACATLGQRGLIARVLSLRPLTYLGTISYGVYLWHWPVNVFLTGARVHVRGAWLHILHFCVTLVIAIVSYRLLERPIRTRGLPFGRPVYMVPAAVTLAVLLIVRATNARPALVLAQAPPSMTGMLHDVVTGPELPPFQVLVLGDSTANSLGWGLRGLRKPGVSVDLHGIDGCTMLGDTCGGPGWGAVTKEIHPNATLVVLAGGFMHGIDVNGVFTLACHPQWQKRFRDNIVSHLSDLKSTDGEVWVVTIPYPLGVWEGAETHAQTDCINVSLREAAFAVPDIHLLDLAEHLCPNGHCSLEFDGVEIRPDGVHYSIDGARGVARWVLDQVQP